MNFKLPWDKVLCGCAAASQILVFALLLATMVGPVPNYSTGSFLQHIWSSESHVDVWVGPMGSCLRRSDGAAICSTATIAPDFNTTFIAAGIPTTLQGQLPTSLDLPPILLFVIIASAICWLPTAVVVASRLLVNRKDLKIHLYAPLLNSVALVGMSIVLAFDLTVASCFQIQMSRTASEFDKFARLLQLPWRASPGRGIGLLWAAVAFTGVTILSHLGLAMTMPKPQMRLSRAW